MDERFDALEEKLEELAEKLEEISCKVDSVSSDIESDLESAAESAVESAVYDAVEDAMSNLNPGQSPLITVFSQDKKLIVPVYSVEARRAKKDQEPYHIIAQTSLSGNQRVIGKYPNKETALAEMQKLFKVIYGGPKFYEIK